MSETGEVVGRSDITGDAAQHAFAWTASSGMIDLGTLGGANSGAYAVNNAGEVAGESETADGAWHAFFWSSGTGMIDLGTLGGATSTAAAINSSGQVIGESTASDGGYHAFSWTLSGGMVGLGDETEGALALNASGEVVGIAAQRAFSWTAAGGLVDLGSLNGFYTIADAVNSGGQVVGTSSLGPSTAGERGFSWTPLGGMVEIGTFGSNYSSATAVNDAGQVAGFSGGPSRSGREYPFVWTVEGGLINLGTLGGSTAMAVSINDPGEVTGFATLSGDTSTRTFSWTVGGGLVERGTLGGAVSTPAAMNDRGEIAGTSESAVGIERAALWMPLVPQVIEFTSTPPSTGLVGASYTVEAKGGTSGNPVIFAIDRASTSGACEIAGATVKFTGAGTCIIDANQAGGGTDEYAAAGEAQQQIQVEAAIGSVLSIAPRYGLETGGETITISGTNLDTATEVDFGPNRALGFTINSPTAIIAVAPPGTGVVDVIVSNGSSSSERTPEDVFSYVPIGPAPTIKKLAPKKAPAAGGEAITVTGTGFVGVTAVTFGVTPAHGVIVDSPTSLTAMAPPGTAGPVDVTVTTPNGTSIVSSKTRFKYEPPTIASVSPSTGSLLGGTNMTITGSGFAVGDATQFEFGKGIAIAVDCSSSTSCTALSPAARRRGIVSVVATAGGSKGTPDPPSDSFEYE